MNASAPSIILARRFERLRRRARTRALVHGLVVWLGVGGGALAATAVTLGYTGASGALRWGLVLLCVAIAAAAFVLALWRPLRRLSTVRALSAALEQHGDFANILAAAEEALRRPDRWRAEDPVEAELVRRLVVRASDRLDAIDLPRRLPLVRPGAALALALVVVLGGWLAVDRDVSAWQRGWHLLLRPWLAAEPTPTVGLYLAPAADHVVMGTSTPIAALDFGGGDDAAVAEIRVGSGTWQPLTATPSLPVREEAPGALAPWRRWEAQLADVREDVEYRFRRGARLTPSRVLAVWYPPLLSQLAGAVHPPDYTRLPDQDLDRMPAFLEVPAGSRIDLHGRASGPLAAAAAVTTEGDTLTLAVMADSLSGTVTVSEPLRFHVTLRDVRGLSNRDRLEYELSVLADQVPTAVLARSDDDGTLPLTAPIDLKAAAGDDYGLSAVDLLLRRADTGQGEDWEHLTLWRPGQRDGAGNARDLRTSLGTLHVTTVAADDAVDRLDIRRALRVQAGDLDLVPGDVLELCLEARDNRVPGPAGVGRSEVLRLTVPSTAEVLDDRASESRGQRADLAEARRRTAELGQDLERLRRELQKNPVPDWEKQQELKAAFDRQQALQDELKKIAEGLQQNLEMLAENQLTSPELMAKMDQIAELLQQAQSPELQSLIDQMRNAMQQLSPDEVSRAVREVAQNQEQAMRRLDTAMDMLKDMAREQDLEGMTSMLAQLMREQQKLADATPSPQDRQGETTDEAHDGERDQQGDQKSGDEKSGDQKDGDQKQGDQKHGEQPGGEKADPQELARRQEGLAKEMQELQDRVEKALAELKEQQKQGKESPAAEQMREALEQAMKQMKQDQTGENMQQAGQQMKENMPQDAQQSMQEAMREMAGLYSVMLRTQSAMQMAMKQNQAASLRELAADLLDLSDRQESIFLRLPSQLRDVRIEPLARDQHRVLQATIGVRDGLQKLAKAAPQEIMRLLNNLDDLLTTLGRSVDDLEGGRGGPARSSSRDGLAEMNRIVIGLLTQAQSVGGSGGGGSNPMPQLSQQLQDMAREQAGLNGLAQQLQGHQGLSEQMRAQMQRLQQGQQGLAGQARGLAEDEKRMERHEGSRLLGDMDEMAREMERVSDDVAGGLVTEETLRRQDRILSRLLDAQNAARERDFAKRRESRTAGETYAQQEGLDTNLPRDPRELARRYQSVEQAPPAYRDLVRRYFREIQSLHEHAGRDESGQRRDAPAAGGGQP